MSDNTLTVPVIEKLQNIAVPTTHRLIRGAANEAAVLAVPAGVKLESVKKYIDEYLPAPERKKGTARLDDLDSFIAHVNRTKDDQSVIFADKSRTKPMLLAVYDYNAAEASGGDPRWGKHRARHSFPLSEEYQKWVNGSERIMTQAAFAEFLEERILDVADPTEATDRTREILAKMGNISLAGAAKLLTLSRELEVRVSSKMINKVNLGSGEVQMAWQTENQDEDGKPLVVPGAFLILVPLFQGGVLYPMIVRLRYRVERGSVTWSYSLYRTEEMFELAINTSINRVKEETGLPVFTGMPEGLKGLEEE